MTAPRYSAAHWGIYEVRPGADGQPDLRPLAADPDPTAIGLDQLAPSVRALRIERPAVRRGWLEVGIAAGAVMTASSRSTGTPPST
jgi:biotin/methionine sulfoxide reductase